MGDTIARVLLAKHVALSLIHGDLTLERVDAIVNAANAQLIHGGGVAAAIVRRGGPMIQQESQAWVRAHGPASSSHPALTGGGSLPAQHVIHAVGPRWGEGDEDRKLRAAVQTALKLADEQGFHSLALPAISTGIFGFPKTRGADVIVSAVADFVADHPETTVEDVRITLIDQPSVDVFADAFDRRWPGARLA